MTPGKGVQLPAAETERRGGSKDLIVFSPYFSPASRNGLPDRPLDGRAGPDPENSLASNDVSVVHAG